MSDIQLTAARRAVLQAVSDGEVKHHRRWGRDPDEDVWRPASGGHKRVNAGVEFLRKAGLIKLGPPTGDSMFASRLWQLTDLGEQWLAEHPEES
ncbi:hypothetical protein AB0F72_08670 [Actinoplanes sp. NPDC023936]|uniref:hypothetical protein n=1 Tax=Actinoplanes sp. NPDC023936 TaxID=3154910 RepID=UPI0033D13EEB